MNDRLTLIDCLLTQAETEDRGITLIENSEEERFVSYAMLYKKAQKRLAALQALEVPFGAELILQIEDLEEFLVSFWAGVLGGYVTIPMAVRAKDMKEHLLQLTEIISHLHNPFVLAEEELKPALKNLKVHKVFLTDLDNTNPDNLAKIHPAKPEDIAFVQYSSGSTGKPKGVILSHENILTNINAILDGMWVDKVNDASLSWMPLTHDMGLIGFHLAPLVAGGPQYLMPVPLFVRYPMLWLEKASQHRISILGSPNFGLKLFLSAYKETKTYPLDLASVRLIFNGAEPIDAEVCRRFCQSLEKYGLRNHVFFPVYGLAEASLAVTFPEPGEYLRTVVRHHDGIIKREAVVVGKPVTGCAIKIVDDGLQEVPEEIQGQILIKGKNVSAGYYNNDKETAKAFTPDGWFQTGDLGFTSNQSLVITGRAKEIVVVNGQNYFLHDLERVAEGVKGIKAHKIAFCSISPNGSGHEYLCAFIAFRRKLEEFLPLARALTGYIRQKTGISITHVLPVNNLPVTTSGKRKRHLLVRRFHEGDFDAVIKALALMAHEKESPAPVIHGVLRTISGGNNGDSQRAKRLALLFPGQGSQHIGMGQEMCAYFPVADRTMDEASEVLSLDLKALCFEGDMKNLTRTENAQPALLALSVAKFRVYEQEFGVVPYMAAGHSLGEYAALVCSRALSFRDALKLVRLRGELMRDAATGSASGNVDNGGMSAITGVHKNAVEAQCKEMDRDGERVVVANYNSATQLVISGHLRAVGRVGERLLSKGARVVPLKVSAAFHSPLMQPCADHFAEALDGISFKMPEWQVISNVNALPYSKVENIPFLLKKQITDPIRWYETMEYMKNHQIDAAIELGPKKVLKNLFKKSSRSIKVYSTNTQADLQEMYELEPEDFVEKRPNLLAQCLAMAVSTPNLNFDDHAFQTGVIEPYGKLKEMYYTLQQEKQELEEIHINEALSLLKTIFKTKQLPLTEQNQRLEVIQKVASN
jgi:malonyl CoA-acyl carrier protein transacylase